eukprot:CAMPEP_0179875184 /NCGR_PEP_ID=MMETSP0982-20121206/23384_1 /TAXON_ID=483367 /ORGANISM="non described non described, Strain CCMP 2436" /LENGTH=120 /DNA_ID=CAMNT_0021767225 /DNA_START=15 /DNA_END=378 /DNA_ORIENTATION=-
MAQCAAEPARAGLLTVAITPTAQARAWHVYVLGGAQAVLGALASGVLLRLSQHHARAGAPRRRRAQRARDERQFGGILAWFDIGGSSASGLPAAQRPSLGSVPREISEQVFRSVPRAVSG